MKTTKCIFLALTLVVQTNVQAQLSFGSPQLINAGWQFYSGDNPNDKTVWQTVDLPHDWSVKQPLSPTYASCQGFLPGGIGWYRKNIHIPRRKRTMAHPGKRSIFISRVFTTAVKYL